MSKTTDRFCKRAFSVQELTTDISPVCKEMENRGCTFSFVVFWSAH
jgi:hypothetical protein